MKTTEELIEIYTKKYPLYDNMVIGYIVLAFVDGAIYGMKETEEVFDEVNGFPLFEEESIRLHEEKMARTEKKERMADYSDQESRR